jgi:hypothetical protein
VLSIFPELDLNLNQQPCVRIAHPGTFRIHLTTTVIWPLTDLNTRHYPAI